MIPTSEFIVSGIVEGVSGLTHVIGRCGDSSLRVGDVFETLEDAAGVNHAVRVEIIKVHAYGHDLNELGSGMTGRLSLSGAGVEQITPHCFLLIAASNVQQDSDQAQSSRQA